MSVYIKKSLFLVFKILNILNQYITYRYLLSTKDHLQFMNIVYIYFYWVYSAYLRDTVVGGFIGYIIFKYLP